MPRVLPKAGGWTSDKGATPALLDWRKPKLSRTRLHQSEITGDDKVGMIHYISGWSSILTIECKESAKKI